MLMRSLLLILVLLLQSDPSGDALRTIDEETLKAHESVLASDELEGRAAGFPGNEKAVAYLVKQVESYGLKPAGTDGYLEELEVGSSGLTRKGGDASALLEGADAAPKDANVRLGGHLDQGVRSG